MVRWLLAGLAALCLAPMSAGAQSLVGLQTRVWIDDTRPNLFNAETGRPLDARIWYPTRDFVEPRTIAQGDEGSEIFIFGQAVPGAHLSPGAYPLIVLSHGNGGSAMQLMWLAQALAAEGYVVAALNHHGNTAVEPALLEQAFATPWERALDLSLLIDFMLDGPVFGPALDRERIGVGGFSIGGFSALVAAGGRPDFNAYDEFCASEQRDATCGPQLENPDHSGAGDRLQDDPYVRASRERLTDFQGDPRIQAVFLIAPALGAAFQEHDLANLDAPIALITGDADTVAPASTNAAFIAARSPDARLTLIEGGVGHYTFLGVCGPAGLHTLPALCREEAGVDRSTIHAQASRLALDHFNTALDRH